MNGKTTIFAWTTVAAFMIIGIYMIGHFMMLMKVFGI
jgi:hypothetical protein